MDEQVLIERAMAAVTSFTGLTLGVASWPRGKGRAGSYAPEGLMTLQGSEGPIRFAVECKSRITGESQLSLIRQQLSAWEHEARPLLVTQHLTPRLIEHCRQVDLDFMDVSGNCLLRAHPVWVLIRGNKLPADALVLSRPYKGATTYAALRVVYALLCQPGLLSASYRDIAHAAGVSVGAVALILQDLEERSLISPRDKHRMRRMLDEARLETEWATNFPNKLRPRLLPRRFSAPAADWWRDAKLGEGALWGGEVAAFKLSGNLRPHTQTIYLHDSTTGEVVNNLIRTHRLRADPAGLVEILEAFWNFDEVAPQGETVSPLLVYADLLGIKDSRVQEAASDLRRRFLHA